MMLNLPIKQLLKFIWNTSGIYIIWIIIHWFTLQLYQQYCAPFTLWGLLFGTAIASQMPHCRGAIWIIYQSSIAISQMWIILGSWIVTQLIQITFWKKD